MQKLSKIRLRRSTLFALYRNFPVFEKFSYRTPSQKNQIKKISARASTRNIRRFIRFNAEKSSHVTTFIFFNKNKKSPGNDAVETETAPARKYEEIWKV